MTFSALFGFSIIGKHEKRIITVQPVTKRGVKALITPVVFSTAEIFEGISRFLADYHPKLFTQGCFRLTEERNVIMPPGMNRLEASLKSSCVDLDVGFLRPQQQEDGAFSFLNKKYYSPFVLVEKRASMTVRDDAVAELDLDRCHVIPGIYLHIALTLYQAIRNYDSFVRHAAKGATRALETGAISVGDSSEVAHAVFVQHLESRLSQIKTGVMIHPLYEKSSGEGSEESRNRHKNRHSDRVIRVPVLLPLDEKNELLRMQELRKVVYHGKRVRESLRLPHKSHLGRLDLLETPESLSIGLDLYLSSGARYDAKTLSIVPTSSESVLDYFSAPSRAVPFAHHSDAPRVMMGGKNLKQAVVVNGAERPMIKADLDRDLAFHPGVNALVAFTLFHGLNFEDGIVVSESFAEKMAFEDSCTESVDDLVPLPSEYIIKKIDERTVVVRDVRLEQSKKSTSSTLLEVIYTFPSVGTVLHYGDELLKRVLLRRKQRSDQAEEQQEEIFRYKERYPFRVLREPRLSDLEPFYVLPPLSKGQEVGKSRLNRSKVRILIEGTRLKPLEVGDKITGRHGNKGTVAAILPDKEMPYVNKRGKAQHVDMLLSPLGIITRMNIGQLLETSCSAAGISDGRAFEHVDFKELVKRLLKCDWERSEDAVPGLFRLYLSDNGFRDCCVGYQYFVRLDHCVRDKMHVVSQARVSELTGQPLKGRKNEGGQRLGEMEFWTLLDHKATELVNCFGRTNQKTWEHFDRYWGLYNDLVIKHLKSEVSIEIEETDLTTRITTRLKQSSRKLGRQRYRELSNAKLYSKEGVPRKVMLGRRVHFSGRAVIVPAVDIDIDHVYLPVDFASEWIMDSPRYWTLRRLAIEGDLEARKELAKIASSLAEKSNLMVLVNRQPSLHKHSIQALRPLFWEHYAVGLPIMVCEGLGADFDGDTVAVYFPVDHPTEELETMLPSRNPFKQGNGELALSVEQDFVYGWNLVKGNKDVGATEKVCLIIREANAFTVAQELLNWQKRVLGAATQKGLSLSFFEALNASGNMKTIIEMGLRGKKENFDSISKSLTINQETFGSFSAGVSARGFLGFGPDGIMENSLVYRGRSSMIDKKIHVAEAGYLTRKLVEFLYPLRIVEEDCGTLEGLSITQEFIEKLCSGDKYNQARLLHGRYVRKALERAHWKTYDQYSKEVQDTVVLRSPVLCAAKDGLCAKCLGLNMSTGLPYKLGDFAGVLAGHTIGERGTQLSMKTFQTGKKDFNMQRVSSVILEIGDDNDHDYLQYLLRLSQIDLALLMGKAAAFHLESPGEPFFKALDVASVYFEILFTMMRRAGVRCESEAMKLTKSLDVRGFFSGLSFETSKKQLDDLKAGEGLDGVFPENSPKAIYALTIDRMR
ncbi:MAG TPA: hypothetical protein DCE14_07800 [Kosmotogaceae bacterium]|nr:hypothetical protein [Kosmotogaceae bacterium]